MIVLAIHFTVESASTLVRKLATRLSALVNLLFTFSTAVISLFKIDLMLQLVLFSSAYNTQNS